MHCDSCNVVTPFQHLTNKIHLHCVPNVKVATEAYAMCLLKCFEDRQVD